MKYSIPKVFQCFLVVVYICVCNGGMVVTGSATDPFQEAADYLHALDEEIFGTFIDKEQIQLMIDLFLERTGCSAQANAETCYQCLSVERLISVIGLNTTNSSQPMIQDVHQLGQAAMVLIYHAQDFNSTCNSTEPGMMNATTFEDIADMVCRIGTEGAIHVDKPCESFSVDQLQFIIDRMNGSYKHLSDYECFNAASLFEDADIPTNTADLDGVHHLAAFFLQHVLQGHCIGETTLVEPRFFVDDVFVTYGNPDGVMMLEDFMRLLKDVGIGESGENKTEIPDNNPPNRSPAVTPIFPTPSTPSFTITPNVTVTMVTTNTTDNSTFTNNPTTTVTPTSGGRRWWNQNSNPWRLEASRPARSLVSDDQTEQNLVKRDLVLEAEYAGNKCFTGSQLFDIFGIDPEVGVNREEFAELCPALVQQISSRACDNIEVSRKNTNISDVYLWGTLAVFVISLCSLLAVLSVPCYGSSVFNAAMHILLALSISTLSGDAFFHLMPEALGLNNHRGGNLQENDSGHQDFILKSLTILCSIYVCFLFERFFKMISGSKQRKHDPLGNGINGHEITLNTSQNNENGHQNKNMDQLLMEPQKNDGESTCNLCQGLSSSSIIILLGDTIHNFMDGLAIGVAFSADVNIGISTSIAIFCHELPHELGDFAVLIKNGMKLKVALFWNFVSSLFAFLGLYVGVNLALSETFHHWIFAVTAGLFLYISLVDLFNTILEVPPHKFGRTKERVNALHEEDFHDSYSSNSDKTDCSCCLFICHNLGLILGWTLMILMTVYEEEILNLF